MNESKLENIANRETKTFKERHPYLNTLGKVVFYTGLATVGYFVGQYAGLYMGDFLSSAPVEKPTIRGLFSDIDYALNCAFYGKLIGAVALPTLVGAVKKLKKTSEQSNSK